MEREGGSRRRKKNTRGNIVNEDAPSVLVGGFSGGK